VTVAEREKHLQRLRAMLDYRLTEIGRRYRFGQEAFLQRREADALAWALETLGRDESSADPETTERTP
jgi:hypothetical protein